MADATLEQLFTSLNPTITILTPNRRLAATLHKQYQEYQVNNSASWFVTPDILPISSWIERIWQQYGSSQFNIQPIILNSLQEQFLWEQTVAQINDYSYLLQITETAETVQSAWHLLKQWHVDNQHPAFTQTEDGRALQRWITDFQATCEQKQWIDKSTLTDRVITLIQDNLYKLPEQLILAGFNELSPQFQQLLDSCQQTGCAISTLQLNKINQSCHRISLADHDHEILSMARFAKATLARHPNARIGCVIPTLDRIRDRVAQLFSEVFADEHTYTIDRQTASFNISAGKSMLHYPVIHTAIQLLTLHKNIVPHDVLSYLLASPFVGEGERERIQRAQYDHLLCQHNIRQINLAIATKKSPDKHQIRMADQCPALATRINDFLVILEQTPKKLRYSEWAATFNQLLTALGWPGERSLNSEEYQVLENWLSLLTEFATLDYQSPLVDYHQALQTLHKNVRKTTFQTKSPDAPIQILGILEAAALPFDYLWIAGLDDLSWPPQPKPNPLIPRRLQRDLNMPHATAERELHYCRQLTQQFSQSATHVIFSYPEKNDLLELQPSPLIRAYPVLELSELKFSDYTPPSLRIYASRQTEVITDAIGPERQPEEKIYGGVSVIKQQALCPFKAFAEWRLHAHTRDAMQPGLRAKDRGTIIHKTLEFFWNKITRQAELLKLPSSDLHEIINECIDRAFQSYPVAQTDSVHYLALEKQRLHKLLQAWLQLEMQRPPFRVLTSEKTEQLTLNKLTLTLKIDRIDELDDQRKLIIDYKTGKYNEIQRWFSERPDEPQLPLYALLDADNTAGIAFAQVAAGDISFRGTSQYELDIKGIKLLTDIKDADAPNWAGQLAHWQQTLTQLSDDFCNGIASVDPKNGTQTCLHCGIKPFCRIHEVSNLTNDD